MAYAQTTYRGEFGGHFHSGGHQFNGSQIHARDMHFYSTTNTRPSPSCILPFPRNRDFIEQNVLGGIFDCLVKPGDRAALVGLGGIGKSQVAIEYAHRMSDMYPQLWVFWVHATNAARFKESYLSIETKADIPNFTTSDPMGSILNWLSSEESGQWLIILDNADDGRVVLGPLDSDNEESATTSHSIVDYLPVSRGSILITTRNKEIARHLVHYTSQVIQLNPMSSDQAVSLLSRKLVVSNDHEKATLRKIAEKLDCMPLALSQAAAFINQQSPRMTVVRYAAELDELDRGSTRLLQSSTGDPWRNREASNCIVLTWHITFRCIAQHYSDAADLLSLMSFFDREAIPAELLKGNYSTSTLHDFDIEIQVLRDFDLVTIGEDPNLFKMHRLVQLSICDWLETKSQARLWSERGMMVLSEAITQPPAFNTERFKGLRAHIVKLRHQKSLDAAFALKQADVLFNGALLADKAGEEQFAVSLLEQVFQTRNSDLGEDHELTLETSVYLARFKHFICMDVEGDRLQRDMYEENYHLTKDLLQKVTTSLGTSHKVTILCTVFLVEACRTADRKDEPGSVMEHAVVSTDDLDARLALADAYVEFKRIRKARDIAFPIYYDRETVWNYNKMAVMRSMAIIARAIHETKQYDESESLCQEVLQWIKKNGFQEHPLIVSTTSTLAITYSHQHRYDEAIMKAEECYALSGKIHGPKDVYTFFMLKNLNTHRNIAYKNMNRTVLSEHE